MIYFQPQDSEKAFVEHAWQLVDETYTDYFERNEKGIDCPACNKAYCCVQVVPSTEAEAMLIIDYVKQWPLKKRRELVKKFASVPNKVNENYRSLCPFLKNNLCQIYAVRPMNCRFFHSSNRSICKKGRKALVMPIFEKLSRMHLEFRQWLEKHNYRSTVIALQPWLKDKIGDVLK